MLRSNIVQCSNADEQILWDVRASLQIPQSTLKNMRFKIRTTAGDSNQTYQHCDDTPVHGTGQGSCASPCLWLLVSNMLLKTHSKQAYGMTRHNVLSNDTFFTTAEGFVDDVALLINNKDEIHYQFELFDVLLRILSYINYDLQLWQEILVASGGKLELAKCFLYILAWKFNKFGDPINLTKQEMSDIVNTNINITDSETGTTISLEHKDVWEAHRTLGAWKTISGDQSEQIKVLKEKSNRLALQTKLGQLTRFQARRAYTSIYTPAMTYSLVATNLTSNDLHKIQSKALFAFLPAMGYEPTFPRAVVHGPRKYGGINISDLYTDMCIAKIGSIIEHIRAKSELGKLMITNVNWTQLHTGSQTPFLESQQEFGYLTNTSWLLHLQSFLKEINGQVKLKDIWRLQLERENDTALMDDVNINTKLKKCEKRIINNWRIYFQVSTLSDITNTDGTHVHSYYWNYHQRGPLSKPPRRSRHNWPIQQQPDITTFKIWRKGITLTFKAKRNGQLPGPLGHWITSPNKSYNTWSSYYDIESRLLYIDQRDGKFWVHEQSSTIRTADGNHDIRFNTTPDDIITEIPNSSIPITIIETGIDILVTIPYHLQMTTYHQQLSTTTIIQTTFDDHINSLESWRQLLIQHWNAIETHQLIQLLSSQNELIIASDGGYDPETGEGTFGAIIATEFDELMSTMGHALQRCDLGSSFRAELYGLLSALVLIHEALLFHQIQTQPRTCVTIFIDNKGVGTRVNRHSNQPIPLGHYFISDMDIELAVIDEINKLNAKGITIRPIRHVKAHQDDITPIYLLPREARLNVMADELATVARQELPFKSPRYQSPSVVTAMLYINQQPITSKYQECIKDAYWTNKLFSYYKGKFQWDDQVIQQIHWTSFDEALRKLSHSDIQRIQKYNINHLHTNVRENYFHPHKSSLCPACTCCPETNYHVVQCQAESRHQLIKDWERSILEYLSQDHTPRTVKIALMMGLRSWQQNKHSAGNQDEIIGLPMIIQEAFHHQTKIGWGQLTRGKISTHWIQIVKQHLRHKIFHKSNITPTRWAANLITVIWQGILNIWDHRNKEVHGHDPISANTKEKTKLLQEAEFLQQQARDNNFYNTHWLNKPIEELQEYTVIALKAWVRNARTISRLYFQEQKAHIKLTRKCDGISYTSQDLLDEGGGTANSNASTSLEGEIESSSRS